MCPPYGAVVKIKWASLQKYLTTEPSTHRPPHVCHYLDRLKKCKSGVSNASGASLLKGNYHSIRYLSFRFQLQMECFLKILFNNRWLSTIDPSLHLDTTFSWFSFYFSDCNIYISFAGPSMTTSVRLHLTAAPLLTLHPLSRQSQLLFLFSWHTG